MSDGDHVLDLTAAYALSALSPDEVRAVDSHCATCPSCAADLAEMRDLVTVLPLACEPLTPSSGLKRRILLQARGDATASNVLRASQRRALSTTLAPWWAGAAAAVFLVGAGMGVSTMVERERMDAQLAAVSSQMQSMHEEIAVDQGAIAEIAGARRVWDMSGGKGRAWWHCTVVQPLGAKAAMLVASMPAEPQGKTFQLWIIRHGSVHDGGMVPAGKTSMMHMPMPVRSGDVVAFTVEPTGGSATPTMPYALYQRLD